MIKQFCDRCRIEVGDNFAKLYPSQIFEENLILCVGCRSGIKMWFADWMENKQE